MSIRIGLIGLLALFAGFQTQPPFERAEALLKLELQLAAVEAEAYLPQQTERLKSQIELLLQPENFTPSLQLYRRMPQVERRVEEKIHEARRLLRKLYAVKSRLQQEQDATIRFVRQHLEQFQDYRHFPELQPLVRQIEDKVSQTRDFAERGAYEHNLRLMKEVGELFGELRNHWLRYCDVHSPQEVERELVLYSQQLEKLRPEGYFILIDTALNRLSLRQGDDVVLDVVCSTGSGQTLVTSERKWEFKTPRGEFTIRDKIQDPSWRKPDWAFVEAGEAIPDRERDRIEFGALGGYALAFGDGYYIHGTLYKRLLGEPVTHGCVRLGEEDLAQLVDLVPVGTKVYIF